MSGGVETGDPLSAPAVAAISKRETGRCYRFFCLSKRRAIWDTGTTMTRDEPATHKVCSICHKHFDEFGSNAEPVNSGRCCNVCTDLYVIPARIRAMRRSPPAESE